MKREVYDKIHYDTKSDVEVSSEEQLLYDLSGDCREIDPDMENAWNKISTCFQKKRTASGSWLKIAASLLLVGLAGLIYFLNTPISPENFETISSSEQSRNFILPDGSEVFLNAHSELSYHTGFSSKRSVLLEGEAFFEVKKSKVPFTVKTNSGKIEVVGTEFNVKEGKRNLRVLVTSGKVSLSSSNKKVILTPGLEGLVNKKTRDLSVNSSPDLNRISWKTGVITFDNHSLKRAVSVLEDHFKTEIKINDPALENCTITGTFENKSLRSILNSIATVLSIEIRQKKDHYLLKGKGC